MKKPTFNKDTLAADAERLHALLREKGNVIAALRRYRKQKEAELKDAYFANEEIGDLIKLRSHLVDHLIQLTWDYCHQDTHHCCIVAAGGYGRRELLPYSDIDLFIIIPEAIADTRGIEQFIRYLWDIGLKVSHNVVTIKTCQSLATDDLSMITSLLECRLLLGDDNLFNALQIAISPSKIWNSRAFLLAKQEEQKQRYIKYGGSSYNLEPNVKEGPGGLRDIQTILWIGKRHYSKHYDKHLVEMGFLTESEYDALVKGQHFLWNIRCALHYLCKRQEERLLFDYQVKLAEQFCYVNKDNELAIEQFMKTYYRNVKNLNELNDMLVQLFRENILYQQQTDTLVSINERFRVHNDYIEVTHDNVFTETPSALLEIFVIMAKHRKIKGVRASTIRLIRQHRHLIDVNFRENKKNHKLFLALLSGDHNIAKQLKRMNRYGLLGMMIPEYASIIGQMQYDLFHVYTVDQHLLSVINHVYLISQDKEKFPVGFELMQNLKKRYILNLAALFHDIGKGKGGDHSELGEKIVEKFCRGHHITKEDTELLAWLVANHLLMSTTAQQQDIHDPQVISQFTKTVATQQRLDYLYLLTVADICGTNPSLWNSWKDTLLKNLYQASKLLFSATGAAPSISEIKQQVLAIIKANEDEKEKIHALWQQWRDLYFRRNNPEDIARHTLAILHHPHKEKPLVTINNYDHGATEVFIYIKSQNYHFATTTVVLDRFNMNIVEAQVTTTNDDYKLDNYYIINKAGKPLADQEQIHVIKHTLEKLLSKSLSRPAPIARRLTRRQKHFNYPARITFKNDSYRNRTNMYIVTPDRPGLLARISMALVDCEVLLQGAKIVTMGERVEDVFFITNMSHNPLTAECQDALKQRISYYLGQYK